MGFEDPFKPFKDIIDKGLKKITPEDKPEEDERDNLRENSGKFFEKTPEDYKKEEEEKRKEGKGEEAEKL